MTSNVLPNESAFKVSSALVSSLGLSSAIVLQKLYFLLSCGNGVLRDGKNWYFASYQKWYELIPFISQPHLKRTLQGLENEKIIISSKSRNSKGEQGKWYAIDFEVLSEKGFESGNKNLIIPKNSINQFVYFILPSLVTAVGIPSAIILQRMHYSNLDDQITLSEINGWVSFICLKQTKRLLLDLQKRDLVINESPNNHHKNGGRFYSVNREALNKLLSETCRIKMSLPVDKSIESDVRRIKMSLPAGSKCPYLSIDQDLTKISKETNNKGLARSKQELISDIDRDTIPEKGQRSVLFDLKISLKAVGITHSMIERLITQYDENRIKQVLAASKNANDSAAWTVSALQGNWKVPELNVEGNDMATYTEAEKETHKILAYQNSIKRSTNETGTLFLQKIKSELFGHVTHRESNRESLERMAQNPKVETL